MSDVKKLLAEADEAASVAHDYIWPQDAKTTPTREEASDAIWTVHNALRPLQARLPDYEAAVEALEAVLPFVGMSLSISGHDVECTLSPCSCGVIEKHNAAVDALARLRESVPA